MSGGEVGAVVALLLAVAPLIGVVMLATIIERYFV